MRLLFLGMFLAVVALGAAFVYERMLVQSMFGPSSLLAVLALLVLALVFLASYVLYRSRFREAVAKFWLVITASFFTYASLDLLAGWILITPLSPSLSADEVLHHKLLPNTYSKFEHPDFHYIQRVNNLGLRGRDTTWEKPAGRYRILMLGDSFTMGKGVEDSQTFSALIEDSMNQADEQCSSRRVEVLNAGVDSYAPVLEYLQLSRGLSRLEPDLVVLNLDVSDLIQETVYRSEAIYGPEGEVVAVPGVQREVSASDRVRRWIENNLYVTRLILYYTNRLLGYQDLTVRGVVEQASPETVLHTLAEDTADRANQWESVFDSILDVRDFCLENGIKFILSIYPWAHQVSDSEWRTGRLAFMSEDARPSDRNLEIVSAFAESNGLTLVNAFPEFRSYDGGDKLYFEHDMHWTATGHRVMANSLEPVLKSAMGDCP